MNGAGRRSTSPGDLIATGGAFEQPGLRDYLARHAGLNFQPWPTSNAPGRLAAGNAGFEIALGAALQALGSEPATRLLAAGEPAARPGKSTWAGNGWSF